MHYIYHGDGLAAIYTKQYSSENMYYVHKDHLGSLDKLTNSAGAVVQSNSYDAWGRRRNPSNWTYTSIPSVMFSRGYTGHCLSRSSGKHLDQFDLINMNGRIYDPLLGRFLSADKYVQNPFGSQSYNRYSYVVNNPLKYTDPSGWKFQHDIVRILNASRHGGQWSSERGFSFYASDDEAREANGGGGGIYEDTQHLNMHFSFKGFRVQLFARRGLEHQKWQWVPTFRNLLPTISFNITNDLVWVPNSQVWDDGDASSQGFNKIDLSKSNDPVRDVIEFMNSSVDREVSGTIPDNFYLKSPSKGNLNGQGGGMSFPGEFEGNQVSVYMQFSASSKVTSIVTVRGFPYNGDKLYQIVLWGTKETYASQTRNPRLITITTTSRTTAERFTVIFSR